MSYEDDSDYQQAMQSRRAWVSNSDLAALGLERATGMATKDGSPESPVEQANRMMREAAPMAASSLVRLAQNGETEQVRLKASIEILNRASQSGTTTDGREPWAEVYDKVLATDDVERFANDPNGR